VAKAFIREGVSIPWGAYFAPTTPPDGYYELMAEAGIKHIEFGTESMSDSVLEAYGKPFRVEDVFRAHESAIDAGINAAHYMLLGGPGETEATLMETLNRLEQIPKSVFFFFCGMRIYPYTALYDIALEEGQISGSQNLLDPVYYHTKELTSEEIVSRVEAQANGRLNWVIGSGGKKMEKVIRRLYKRGFSGLLWEFLIQ